MIRILSFLAAGLLAFPTAAQAAYSSLFVFGDSLSDNGNAYALSGGTWPPSPPYTQQFSNGPVAAQQLAANLGVPLLPSTSGGTNYAVGGATTGFKNFNFETQSFEVPLPVQLPPTLENTGVLAQVGSFIATKPAFDPNQALFMVWAGPDDFFLALTQGSSIPGAIASAVGNLATAVGELAAAGARHILLPNMPNLADTPLGLSQTPANRAALEALSQAFDDALAQALAQLATTPGLDLTAFDIAALLNEVLAKPGDFGFNNITDPCLFLASCQGYFYFDEVHPTSAGHAIIGDRLFAALQVPEPPAQALLAIALLGIWASRRRSPAFSAASPAGRSTA